MSDYRILLVEDNPDDAQLMREAFLVAHPQAQINSVGCMSEALRYLSLQPVGQLPHLVITDHHLPDGDGECLIESLADDQRYGAVRMVMLSGDDARPAGLKSVSWFAKPDTWTEWIALVRTLVS